MLFPNYIINNSIIPFVPPQTPTKKSPIPRPWNHPVYPMIIRKIPIINSPTPDRNLQRTRLTHLLTYLSPEISAQPNPTQPHLIPTLTGSEPLPPPSLKKQNVPLRLQQAPLQLHHHPHPLRPHHPRRAALPLPLLLGSVTETQVSGRVLRYLPQLPFLVPPSPPPPGATASVLFRTGEAVV